MIEDNPDSRLMLCELLKIAGFECETATAGRVASSSSRAFSRRRARRHRLAGNRRPRVHEARPSRARGTSGMQLIALTGYWSRGSRARAPGAGFDHHLVKPVDPNALIQLLGGNPLPSFSRARRLEWSLTRELRRIELAASSSSPSACVAWPPMATKKVRRRNWHEGRIEEGSGEEGRLAKTVVDRPIEEGCGEERPCRKRPHPRRLVAPTTVGRSKASSRSSRRRRSPSWKRCAG